MALHSHKLFRDIRLFHENGCLLDDTGMVYLCVAEKGPQFFGQNGLGIWREVWTRFLNTFHKAFESVKSSGDIAEKVFPFSSTHLFQGFQSLIQSLEERGDLNIVFLNRKDILLGCKDVYSDVFRNAEFFFQRHKSAIIFFGKRPVYPERHVFILKAGGEYLDASPLKLLFYHLPDFWLHWIQVRGNAEAHVEVPLVGRAGFNPEASGFSPSIPCHWLNFHGSQL